MFAWYKSLNSGRSRISKNSILVYTSLNSDLLNHHGISETKIDHFFMKTRNKKSGIKVAYYKNKIVCIHCLWTHHTCIRRHLKWGSQTFSTNFSFFRKLSSRFLFQITFLFINWRIIINNQQTKRNNSRDVMVTWRSDNLFQLNNILMMQLLQNLDFTNCSYWKLQIIQNLRIQFLKRICWEKICMEQRKMYILLLFHYPF